jgi:hypothetical protein
MNRGPRAEALKARLIPRDDDAEMFCNGAVFSHFVVRAHRI